MSADQGDKSPDAAKKAARKEALKEEAKELGIPYEELKKQKKEKKERKKGKSREADALKKEKDSQPEEMDKQRMRAWSKEDLSNDDAGAKRRRTRSMDAAEDTAKAAKMENGDRKVTTHDAVAWRKENDLTIKKKDDRTYSPPDPFYDFKDAPFNDAIQRALARAGFEKPTLIQSQAWPIAITGQDMICIAKTGSGKTCGFLLPSLHRHLKNPSKPAPQASAPVFSSPGRGGRGGRGRGGRGGGGRGFFSSGPPGNPPMMLVLAPTRELACQIQVEAEKFSRELNLRAVCVYGGAPKSTQIASIRRGVDCVIATPGRLNDLLEMKVINLASIQFVVLDEADRMLDMGFEPQIRSIMDFVPKERQTLLFSATWPKEIQRLAYDFLNDPVQVNVGEVNSLNANKDIKQNILMMAEGEKFNKLVEIIKELNHVPLKEGEKAPPAGAEKAVKMIVFVAKKFVCDDLANELWNSGYPVDSLHGDRAQWERTKVITAFKSGTLQILIATDVAARGLDVKDVGAVINYDMPSGNNGVEDYVHRIGRTGRAGAKGTAYTFFTQGDRKVATQLVEVLTKAQQEVPPELQGMVRSNGRFGGGGRGGRGGRFGGRGGRGGRGGGRGSRW